MPTDSEPSGNAGRSFYLVTTPYHLLLALAHAEAARRPTTIFLFGRFEGSQAYLEALTADAPFLPDLRVAGQAGSGVSEPSRRGARKAMLALLAAERPDHLFIFNDRNEVGQAALDLVAGYGGQRHCIEDGSSFYTDWRGPPASRWITWRKRTFTTRSWEAVEVLGMHPLTQHVLVLRPASVRPELQGRAEALGVDLLSSPVLSRFATAVVARLDMNLPACPDLLVLPALEAGPGWAGSLAPMADGRRIAIKYHPRDPGKDAAGLAVLGPELPRHLAVELLYLAWGRTPPAVVGDGHSTTLLTTRLFDPDCDITGLYAGARPAHSASFQRLGIKLLPVNLPA